MIRNDAQEDARFKRLAREYAQGRVTIREAATLLGLDLIDVLAAFEHLGCSRTIDQIRLDDEQRAKILKDIAADCARRGGHPAYSSEAVARDTIASERLEGVDARRWIRRGADE